MVFWKYYSKLFLNKGYFGGSTLVGLGTIGNIHGYVLSLFDLSGWPKLLTLGVVVICFFLIPALYALVHILLGSYRNRNGIFIEGMRLINTTLSHLNQYRSDISSDSVLFKTRLANICELTKQYFDKYTHSDTSVSIKIPLLDGVKDVSIGNKNELQMEVFNLCRDKLAEKKRDRAIYLQTKHTLCGNSCYRSITMDLMNKRRDVYYVNNHIQKRPSTYETTSLNVYSDKGSLDDLPYKSELVLPILPLDSDKTYDFPSYGFICVDSNKTQSFMEQYEVVLLQCIADSIFDIIKKYKDGLPSRGANEEQKEAVSL